MQALLKYSALFFIAGAVFLSCKKDMSSTSRPTTPKKVPVAQAGTDQTIVLPVDSVELSGSGTDADGTIETFTWTKVAGPNSFIVANRNAANTIVKNLAEGTYEFELEVKDNDGLSGKDTVVVAVASAPPAPIDTYRSKTSGNWNVASSWEKFDGNWISASEPPAINSKINIRAGHTIVINTAAEAKLVDVDENGVLMILADFTLTDELINNGTLYWQNGTLNLLGGYSIVTLHNNGNFVIEGNNETWSYWWDSDVRIVNNGVITKTSPGFTSLEAAHSVVNTPNGIIQGLGTLSASGNIDWLPGAFDNKGIISPGLPIGILSINKVLQPFSPESTLKIEILDNSGPGTGHDQLNLDNSVTLNGELTVIETGAGITNGSFTIISTTGTINGNFTSTNLPPGYTLQVNTNSVKLVK